MVMLCEGKFDAVNVSGSEKRGGGVGGCLLLVRGGRGPSSREAVSCDVITILSRRLSEASSYQGDFAWREVRLLDTARFLP